MNLLDVNNDRLVEKTTLTRKLTLDGKTVAYPVYRVRLDQIFYNDQNDRIATWITQYKNDKDNVNFKSLEKETYNNIIEKFIIESNPEAISKTKMNISMVGQREPGVILSDGRIIDGNRRFTCLRLLHQENEEVNYFETVILDATIENSQKQIKMLELSIQHGEEQRVGYNLIDMAVGAYHDIVETQLLTIEEYAQSTNEPIAEVKRRLETATLINEFLDFMKVPQQYHIAREMQIYSVFFEFVPILKKCTDLNTAKELKTSVFNNVMMGSFDDNRKYIRNVKSMMESSMFTSYMKQQKRIDEEISKKKEQAVIHNKKELDEFINSNTDAIEDLQVSMDRFLLQTKKEQTKNKPTQIVTKSISMLMDIDTKIVDKMSVGEKDKLKTQLTKLTSAIKLIDNGIIDENYVEEVQEKKAGLTIAHRHIDEPLVCCLNENNPITNLNFPLTFSAYKFNDIQQESIDFVAYFIDENSENLCPIKEVHVTAGEEIKVNFSLNSRASTLKTCQLIIKSKKDKYNEAQQIIQFNINITFNVEFDF